MDAAGREAGLRKLVAGSLPEIEMRPVAPAADEPARARVGGEAGALERLTHLLPTS